MAKIATIALISCFLVSTLAINAEEKAFLYTGKEKVVKLNFYVQDLRVGNPSPTVYEVAAASVTGNSPTQFGSVHVVDDLLTEKPDYNSRAVGRVQGLTTSGDLSVNAVAINLNFYFTMGEYNGSTISIVGRNEIGQAARELPVVGGTGLFRFATGYSLSSTYSYDAATSHTVIEYTFYVKTASARLKNIEQEFVV